MARSYKDEEELRGTVVHEFTHHYLYAGGAENHDHDDRFYSAMEGLEDWLNQKQNLKPRQDKSHDRDQYVGDSGTDTDNINSQENFCPECSCLAPVHSPQCSRKNNSLPPKNEVDPQKAELDSLKNLLKSSQDLTALENNYQKVKNSPFYSSKIVHKNDKGNYGDNKNTLDALYQVQKWHLQSQNNRQNSSADPKNKKPEAGSIF